MLGTPLNATPESLSTKLNNELQNFDASSAIKAADRGNAEVGLADSTPE